MFLCILYNRTFNVFGKVNIIFFDHMGIVYKYCSKFVVKSIQFVASFDPVVTFLLFTFWTTHSERCSARKHWPVRVKADCRRFRLVQSILSTHFNNSNRVYKWKYDIMRHVCYGRDDFEDNLPTPLCWPIQTPYATDLKIRCECFGRLWKGNFAM